LITSFLVGHGLVHAVMWALPYREEAMADLPMDPAHSWLLGDMRAAGFALALVTATAFLVAAGSYAFDAAWWPGALLVGAALSVALLGLFFSRWWVIGLMIDAVLIVVALRSASAA
jgi:hypothetical protein